MKIHTLLPVLITLFAVGQARATVTITVNSNGGPKYVTSTGTDLALGNVVRVGTFDISGGTGLLTSSNDFAALNAIFTPLAEGRANGGTATGANISPQNVSINNTGTTGNVFSQITGVAGNYIPQGTQLYVWVFNNSNPAAASEWGIFSSTNVLWDFPPDLGSATLSSGTADVVYRGTLQGGALRLAAIPEPSSFALLALGLACFTRRRRS
jgi:hypothetical protein